MAPESVRLRNLVGKWLRTRAEHAAERRPSHAFPNEFEIVYEQDGEERRLPMTQRQLFQQIAADADHSWLLLRLFDGEEPLPFEEWLEAQR